MFSKQISENLGSPATRSYPQRLRKIPPRPRMDPTRVQLHPGPQTNLCGEERLFWHPCTRAPVLLRRCRGADLRSLW